MRSVERLLGSAKHFPLEIMLSSGDKHIIEHPDHVFVHPKTNGMIIFSDEGEFTLAINPAQVVQVRPIRKKGRAA